MNIFSDNDTADQQQEVVRIGFRI